MNHVELYMSLASFIVGAILFASLGTHLFVHAGEEDNGPPRPRSSCAATRTRPMRRTSAYPNRRRRRPSTQAG